MHSRLLSAILAGLCNPTVKLRSTFSLLTPGNERQSIISPSDNAGLPMLSSTENHQYPILVEQMIYRTQKEKIDFLSNSWTFKDVLIRLLDIISSPIKVKIENIYNRSCNFNESKLERDINQGLIDNCSQLLAKVLAEIVYHTSSDDVSFNAVASCFTLKLSPDFHSLTQLSCHHESYILLEVDSPVVIQAALGILEISDPMLLHFLLIDQE